MVGDDDWTTEWTKDRKSVKKAFGRMERLRAVKERRTDRRVAAAGSTSDGDAVRVRTVRGWTRATSSELAARTALEMALRAAWATCGLELMVGSTRRKAATREAGGSGWFGWCGWCGRTGLGGAAGAGEAEASGTCGAGTAAQAGDGAEGKRGGEDAGRREEGRGMVGGDGGEGGDARGTAVGAGQGRGGKGAVWRQNGRISVVRMERDAWAETRVHVYGNLGSGGIRHAGCARRAQQVHRRGHSKQEIYR